MLGKNPTGAAELLARVDAAWERLSTVMARLADENRLEEQLAGGWSAKLTAAHVAAWERSLIGLIAGRSRAAEMGVPEDLFRDGSANMINEAIASRAAGTEASAVLEASANAHHELRALLATLSDEDIVAPYSRYDPGAIESHTEPILDWIAGNTWGHYDEHTAALEAGR